MADAPRRLGRGLATLLGQDAAEPPDPTATMRVIAVDQLRPNPRQPRSDIGPESLADLAQSIAEQGILQPLLVRPAPVGDGQFEIVAGERRWRAARTVGLTSVPCLIQPLTEQAASIAALVENLQRDDLDALDEALGYRRLIGEFSLTQERLAQALGKSRSHVANTLRLLGLPEPVRQALRDRSITSGHARALLADPDPVNGLAHVLREGLSVRDTELLVARDAARKAESNRAEVDRSRPPATDPHVYSVEQRLSERLGLRVTLRPGGRGGKLQITYRTPDQLDGLIRLLDPD